MILRLFGRRTPTVYSEEAGHRVKELAPLHASGTRPDAVFLSILRDDILELVNRYIGKMETEESAKWCRCEWIVHPDDVDVKEGECRECGTTAGSTIHKFDDMQFHGDGSAMNHHYKGKRMRRGETDDTCPVHTKEGLMLYFFEWIYTDAARG